VHSRGIPEEIRRCSQGFPYKLSEAFEECSGKILGCPDSQSRLVVFVVFRRCLVCILEARQRKFEGVQEAFQIFSQWFLGGVPTDTVFF